jgi:anthranilate synthase component 1
VSSYRPSRAEFAELVRSHPIVPVWREVLTDVQTPVAALMRLETRMDDAFLLESVEKGERWGRYSFLGGDSFASVRARDGRVEVTGEPPVPPEEGEPPLAYVKRLLEGCSAPAPQGLPPLHGGAVGYIGYDCVRELERLPHPPPDDLGLPDLALLLTRTFVVFDHLGQRAFVITNVARPADVDAAYDDAIERCDSVVEALASPLVLPAATPDFDVPVAFASPVDDAEYARWVQGCREHIFAGDIFQAVPSRRFEADLTGTTLEAYRVLRVLNPSPYMYYLRFSGAAGGEDLEIAGSSPEPLVRVTGDLVTARPIAGTRARGATEEEDGKLEAELVADEKERAEHVMLVDLARNDVGRVSAYGTVTVDELMVVERYSHVMHLVSSVSGRLAPGRTAFDALTASFPAGTVSGAPKVRAMEIIDSLERTRRGPYAGVVGYVDFSGNLDTCIAIRTIVSLGGKAYVQAGAGVVADSVPEAEAEETRRKAQAVLVAAAASGRLAHSGGPSSL